MEIHKPFFARWARNQAKCCYLLASTQVKFCILHSAFCILHSELQCEKQSESEKKKASGKKKMLLAACKKESCFFQTKSKYRRKG
jgi:hypothetical protein